LAGLAGPIDAGWATEPSRPGCSRLSSSFSFFYLFFFFFVFEFKFVLEFEFPNWWSFCYGNSFLFKHLFFGLITL